MDPMVKLTRSLEALGGPLQLDRFLEALATDAAAAAAARPPRPAAPDPDATRPVPLAVAGVERQPSPSEQRPDPARGGAIADEVEAFMHRDAIEGTSDDEVKEFLKERAGFDPTELE